MLEEGAEERFDTQQDRPYLDCMSQTSDDIDVFGIEVGSKTIAAVSQDLMDKYISGYLSDDSSTLFPQVPTQNI